MTILIYPDNPAYKLGVSRMDETHQEFIDLVNKLGIASKAEFSLLFEQLLEHTEKHFADENQLMQTTGFPAIREHIGEHQRILGDLHRIGRQVINGSTLLARAYVKEHLPSWFDLHARTMDSALAAHVSHKSA